MLLYLKSSVCPPTHLVEHQLDLGILNNLKKMANTDLIVPLVVAAIGLVGTVVSLLWGWHMQRVSERQAEIIRKNEQKHSDEMAAIGRKHEKELAEYTANMTEQLEDVKIQVEQRKVAENLTQKYSPPLLVAVYDLQQRLFELVEYPISRQHVSAQEGLDDFKIFSCYLLAR